MNLLRRRMFAEQDKVITLELKSITENASWINGFYINGASGEEVKYATWKATDYILINPDDILCVVPHGISQSYNAFYDSERNYVGVLNLGNERFYEKVILKIPESARYIRLSNKINQQEIQIYKCKII